MVCKYLKQERLWREGNGLVRAVAALFEFGHAAAEPVASEFAGGAFGLFTRRRGAGSTVRSSMKGDAHLATDLSIAAGGVHHGGDKDDDEGDARNHWPLGFGFRHD